MQHLVRSLISSDTSNSFLVVIDVSTDRQDSGLPTEAYVAVDTVREDGKPVEKTWKHLASGIGAEEAEEVGVEQLLRDVHNPTAGSLRYPFPSSVLEIFMVFFSQKITAQLASIRGLLQKLEQIHSYLSKVVNGKIPPNHQVMYHLQDVLSLVPDLIPLTKECLTP